MVREGGGLSRLSADGGVRGPRANATRWIFWANNVIFLVFNFTDLALQLDTSGPESFINGMNNGKYTSRSFVASEEHDGGLFIRPL